MKKVSLTRPEESLHDASIQLIILLPASNALPSCLSVISGKAKTMF